MPKHVNYYKHQYIRETDMQAEQGYHIDMRRLHNEKLHTSGVVVGLVIAKKSDTEVTISIGVAIDKRGREIVLESEQTHTISGDGERFITIAHKEEATDDPDDGFNVTGNDKIRVTESWKITDSTEAPDPEATDPEVMLGLVVMEGGKIKDIHDGTALNHRRMSGAAGNLTIRDSKYSETESVTLTLESPNQVRLDGFLRGNQKSGALRISTLNGYVDIGPQDNNSCHFVTDKDDFSFNKPLFVDSGLIGSQQNKDLKLHTGGTERMTVLNSNGNVGIGTGTPEARLHTDGDALISGKVRIGATFPPAGALLNVGGSAFIENAGQGLLINPEKDNVSLKYSDKNIFDPSPITNLRLSKGKTIIDGKVGIGSSPLASLSVQETGSGKSNVFYLRRTSGSKNQNVLFNLDPNNAVFHLDVSGMGNSRARIHIGDLSGSHNPVTTLGNVGIGITSPVGKLDVTGGFIVMRKRASNSTAKAMLAKLPVFTLIIGGPSGDGVYFYWKSKVNNKSVLYRSIIKGTTDW